VHASDGRGSPAIVFGEKIREWRHVPPNRRPRTYAGISAYRYKVVRAGHILHHRSVAHMDMACQLHDPPKMHAIVHETIVGNMHALEQRIIVADSGNISARLGADVNGNVPPDTIIMAYYKQRVGSAIFEVLRRSSQHAAVADNVARAYGRVARNGNSSAQHAARPDGNVRPDYAKRPDRRVGSNAG